ncbi:hypothetical protein SAMN05444722_1999 [Rhodovulum sp. ES.010]|uniref:hypothetical protein n=1 Tax=Rhodovulum sp. ES.010 TaxID=1882821 RepID=UPI0009258E9A|nr:hypothetical protein [Rhodovulum sp. ES.010]SIO41602.1 hypothetical protein SAMN05444722_1999 [Rhodovulum sp. ES.010]
MVLVVFILLSILIGWVVPQVLVPRLPGRVAVLVASLVALLLGAGAVWVGAQVFDGLGVEAADSAFSRGFNAWKIMLLVAPASALQARRQLEKEQR